MQPAMPKVTLLLGHGPLDCKGDLAQTDRLGHAGTDQETTAHTCIFTPVYSGRRSCLEQ